MEENSLAGVRVVIGPYRVSLLDPVRTRNAICQMLEPGNPDFVMFVSVDGPAGDMARAVTGPGRNDC